MKNLTTKLFAGSIAAALLIAGCGAEKVIDAAPKASADLAQQASADAKAIAAKKVAAALNDITPESELWSGAAFTNVTLYPQTTISFNDKKAIEMNKNNGAKTAKVAALYNDKEIALAIIWKDATESYHKGATTDLYADGVAFQFAKDVKNPAKLPYIGMGSEGREVAIYLQKAQFNNYEPHGTGKGQARVETQVNRHQTNAFGKDLAAYDKQVADLANDDYERKFVSAGFRSMTEIKDGSATSNMKIARIEGYGWIATLTRPLKDAYADASKSAAVAFAVWDGGKNNRNGLKLLSGWTAVTTAAENKALIDAVNEQVKGDVKNGQEQAVINCASCHSFPGANAPSKYMAPDLSNIGGYATAAYIKESMLEPHAVVVPGYNVNAHSSSPWYMVMDGKRQSMMPAFNYLDEKTVNDIVAYFQTLKAKGE